MSLKRFAMKPEWRTLLRETLWWFRALYELTQDNRASHKEINCHFMQMCREPIVNTCGRTVSDDPWIMIANCAQRASGGIPHTLLSMNPRATCLSMLVTHGHAWSAMRRPAMTEGSVTGDSWPGWWCDDGMTGWYVTTDRHDSIRPGDAKSGCL